MTEQQFISNWYAGLAIAAVIVVVVAVLVLAIIVTARRILANAQRALTVANEIVENTQPIWELEKTNAVASQLSEGAEAIAQHATEMADTLEASTEPAEPAVE
jgi:hypothetical protein